MRLWKAAWPCFGVVLVGAFLPWAQIDVDRALGDTTEPIALAARVLTAFAGNVPITAWNGHVDVGTAAIPAWVVLVAGGLAAFCSMLRANNVRAISHLASPLLAAAGLALIVTLGVQRADVANLLAGFWVTTAGALCLTASVVRDPAPSA